MKLVHISDIHINGEPILGHDSIANFKKCLAYVEAHDHDADRVVITGDLTHYGLEESYRELQVILEASSLKGKLAPRLMIGNHDNREMFASMFAETNRDAAGFVQWTEETPAGLFVYMDTVDQGKHSGRYCQQRMDWLRTVLDGARAKGQRAYLFMHHNPVRVHVANADIIGIIDERALQALLAEYKDTVAHLFFGHCHYTLSGAVCGIPYSAPRSTNHTCWPEFSGEINRMGYGDLAPNYNVCFLNENSTVVHSIDFLEADRVKWRIDTDFNQH
ncbi:metallophosphoesterase [Hoeflea sp. EC-HK425]|uniref:metallophosphoesterase n=1 Tax=Hoeflea sp. EC-HK425 TaxID=2038388 RepID=UPI001252E937|nr:metallophosphoesterase [Hoeflea sp. EC-HK425]VVT10027.1 Phosphodiesterase [Hoeflea sp. EC-HK425]|tara:strand:+ start:459 stop:1283 length:825 start_codon:yes stop_codon:yes gene_type:complete